MKSKSYDHFINSIDILFQRSMEAQNMTVAFKALELLAKVAWLRKPPEETFLEPQAWTEAQLQVFIKNLEAVVMDQNVT